jgi:hypothetical protein
MDTNPDLVMTDSTIGLEQEYRSIREALINAGLMTGSIDALYADWLRWRNTSVSSRAGVNAVDANQWWARHLSQFRCLMDPAHLAARAVRARKDARE